MNEILAVAQSPEHDDALVAELARRLPARVTVLLADRRLEGDPAAEQRLAELVVRAERATGAVVVGVAAPDGALEARHASVVQGAGAVVLSPA
jgi:hypothetical protein